MAITNYTELQTEVGAWLNRSDLSSKIPDFITLAESEFNRRIRIAQNETRTTLSVSSNTATLPSDFAAIRSLSDADGELTYVVPAEFANYEENDATSSKVYTIVDDTIRTMTSEASLTLAYYATIPALASNSTNWLLTRSPNLYLFTSLAYGALYLKDSGAMVEYRAIAEGNYAQLVRDDRQRAGPLEVRAR